MLLVGAETARMEAVRMQQLPYMFQRLPLNAHGNLPLSEVSDIQHKCIQQHVSCVGHFVMS